MTAPAETRTNEATMTAIVAVSTVEAFSTDFLTPRGSVCSDLVSDFLVDFFSSPVETGVSVSDLSVDSSIDCSEIGV